MSDVSQDNNDRLIRQEKDIEALAKSITKIETKVDAMYEAFVMARGIKWMIAVVWMGVGAILLKTVGWFWPPPHP